MVSLSKFVAPLTVAFAGLLWNGAASAGCARGICASGVTNGGVVNVTYRVQNGPVSHVNIRSGYFLNTSCEGFCPDPVQREGPRSGTFNLRRERSGPTTYMIQACVRGGVFQRSSCGAWASFRHN